MNSIPKSLATLALPFAVLMILTANGPAQETKPAKKEKVDSPVGVWHWEREAGEEKIKTQVTIIEKNGKFSGKLKDPDHDLEFKNGTLKDGTFSFEVSPHAENPEVVIKFSGKVSSDKITGTMNFTTNEEAKSIPWIAKREDPIAAVLGKWLLEFETPDGQAISFTIEAKKKGDGLGLSFVDDDSAKIKKVKFKDGVLSFDTNQVYQEQPLTVEWDLKIKGNQATGVLFYSFDNDAAEQGEIEVAGERVK